MCTHSACGRELDVLSSLWTVAVGGTDTPACGAADGEAAFLGRRGLSTRQLAEHCQPTLMAMPPVDQLQVSRIAVGKDEPLDRQTPAAVNRCRFYNVLCYISLPCAGLSVRRSVAHVWHHVVRFWCQRTTTCSKWR